MEQEVAAKLEEQNKKLDNIFRSVEKTRKYFLWTMIINLAMIILPLIGLLIVVPQLISIYANSGLGF